MTTVHEDMTLQQLLEIQPQVRQLFVAHDLAALVTPDFLAAAGRFLTLRSALAQQGRCSATFVELLRQQGQREAALEAGLYNGGAPVGLGQKRVEALGLLPCPVRLPVLEAFDGLRRRLAEVQGLELEGRFEAAAVGADWMAQLLRQRGDVAQWPDLIVSAGFDLLFDRQLLGPEPQRHFQALAPAGVYPQLAGHDWQDPAGIYTPFALVPAVFMVDRRALGGLPVPHGWADLLQPAYAGRVAVPVGDFDLFNAILLTIQRDFGDEGVRQLGRALQSSAHPAQLVADARQSAAAPAVTILPYFFTRMAGNIPGVEIVWPDDGAIVSPIFMLLRRQNWEDIRPVAEFFAGVEVGTLLAHKGLFPALHPQVDNRLPPQAPLKWLGWQQIYHQDVPALLRHCLDQFGQAAA
ncbi:ABC transporter substrate-binding protein [Desulfuromonas thiophila]|uniref:ABC-type Fe3+ transport system, substrate-binding protein n=1 Tax=Desulfuromonas thiophila TaxID=57664 RepID=A0A1G6YXB2_9BACT|nr:ABC transporter substrate-binding protein [Desulfuromonas thiophila]SDD95039.1 ABC-type Fe3+ transport system, substrate-binding protein [Desulfuromonas thiophila]